MTREEAVSIIKERIRVTEYVDSSYVDCVDIEALRMAIKALELEPQWIPVTKKLPEKNVWVLVTFMMANGEVDTDIMRINRWDGGWDTHTFDMAYRETVIAWMPLPKPYGGEQE